MEELFGKIFELFDVSYMFAAYLLTTGVIMYSKKIYNSCTTKLIRHIVTAIVKFKAATTLTVSTITAGIFYWLHVTSLQGAFDFDYAIKLLISFAFNVVFYDLVKEQIEKRIPRREKTTTVITKTITDEK